MFLYISPRFLLEVRPNAGAPSITPALICVTQMRLCQMRAVITSQLWFLDLQVYSMLVKVLNILQKTLLYSLFEECF